MIFAWDKSLIPEPNFFLICIPEASEPSPVIALKPPGNPKASGPIALSIGAVAFGPSTAREENVILFVSLISQFMITKERSTISYPYKR